MEKPEMDLSEDFALLRPYISENERPFSLQNTIEQYIIRCMKCALIFYPTTIFPLFSTKNFEEIMVKGRNEDGFGFR